MPKTFVTDHGWHWQVDDQDPYMPLSTIERPRMGGHLGVVPGVNAGPNNSIYHRRTVHTPPQTPPYHGTLNGQQSQSPYGHLTGPAVGVTPPQALPANAATLGANYRNHHHQYHAAAMAKPGGHAIGTLGRNSHHQAK